jgi:PEP-CTERM motif
MKLTHFILTNTAALALAIANTSAATITWGAPTNINPAGGAASDLDVSTAGTLVGAFNFGDTGVSSALVNTVAFQSFAVPNATTSPVTLGNFTLSPGPGVTLFTSNTNGGFGAAPFNTLSTNYQALLAPFVVASNGNGPKEMTLTMSGLTEGAGYQFEWWSNTSQNLPFLTTATAGGAVTLSPNTASLNGGLGQYAIGTFTADATTTQAVTFTSPANPFLNGFQLRQLAPPPVVPEPGTALFGLALTGAALTRRHRRV